MSGDGILGLDGRPSDIIGRLDEVTYQVPGNNNIAFYTSLKDPVRDVCFVKTRGWRKLKKDTQVTQQ